MSQLLLTEDLTKLNRDAGLIKLVAIISMVIDHVGAVFFPYIPEMRIVGRIAMPLFCYGIVMGSVHSRNLPKYAFRLLLGFIIAQPFYMLALNHSIREWNVLATLLLGLVGIIGIQKKTYGSQYWLPLICLALASVQKMDYGWKGVLLIFLMYLVRDSRGGMIALMVSFCLYWGAGSSEINVIFGQRIKPVIQTNSFLYPLAGMFFSLLRLQSLAILSLPFIIFPTHTGIRMSKFLNYAMYPGHLLLIWVLKLAFM